MALTPWDNIVLPPTPITNNNTRRQLKTPPKVDAWAVEGYLRLGDAKQHMNQEEINTVLRFLNHPKVRECKDVRT